MEPNWRHYACYSRAELPKAIRPWLLTAGSMTKRLLAQFGENFHVRLLQQNWQQIRFSEYQLLGLKQPCYAKVREVKLQNGNQAVIVARSIFPASTLQGSAIALQTLGQKPLGKLLYSDPLLKTSAIEIACLRPRDADYQRAVKNLDDPPKVLWARRRVFYLYGKPLLVNEIFLPDCYQHAE